MRARHSTLAERLGEDGLLASASRALGNLLARTNQLPEGLDLLRRALDLALQADNLAEAAECCACLRMACAWNCEYRQAIAYARQEIDLARRCHAPYLLRHVYTHLTVMYALAGELAEAESAYAEARNVVERLDAPEAWAYFDLIAGVLPMTRGDYAASEQVAVRAIEEFRAANPDTLVWYLGILAVTYARQGKERETLAAIDEAEAAIAAVPSDSMASLLALSSVVDTAFLIGAGQARRTLLHAPGAIQGAIPQRAREPAARPDRDAPRRFHGGACLAGRGRGDRPPRGRPVRVGADARRPG